MKNNRTILKNVNVFDGISDEVQENCMVVMENRLNKGNSKERL